MLEVIKFCYQLKIIKLTNIISSKDLHDNNFFTTYKCRHACWQKKTKTFNNRLVFTLSVTWDKQLMTLVTPIDY